MLGGTIYMMDLLLLFINLVIAAATDSGMLICFCLYLFEVC